MNIIKKKRNKSPEKYQGSKYFYIGKNGENLFLQMKNVAWHFGKQWMLPTMKPSEPDGVPWGDSW